MTDLADRHREPGSDELMGDYRLEQIQDRLDLELALLVEEERRTAAQPADGPG